jgi:polyphenol oxidase
MSYLIPDWPTPPPVKSIITTKKTLLTTENNNWKSDCRTRLSLPSEPIWLKQTHSNRIVKALHENRDAAADASIAEKKDHIAVVLTADCLPILICNKTGNKVAAIHAGWRGLVCGIIANCVQLMHEAPENLLIYLGPAIGPLQFEVGSDVYEAFLTKEADYQRAFTEKSANKWFLNIYTMASLQLNKLGITPQQIFGGSHCTVTESDLFYSYRRNPLDTGRIISLIWFS